jgi:hypothetical protein
MEMTRCVQEHVSAGVAGVRVRDVFNLAYFFHVSVAFLHGMLARVKYYPYF